MMPPPSQDAGTPKRLLADAVAGDEHAFRGLVEIHRPRLLAHCYRILGSLQDAEDAYQDTLLRAWRGLDGLGPDPALSAWLHRIATNVCLTALKRRDRRALPADLGPAVEIASGDEAVPLPDSNWIGPFPDADVTAGTDPGAIYDRRESLELAFVAALQHLPARQRAALVLADVLGFRAREIADTLETTVPAVNSALQRARATLERHRPAEGSQERARTVSGPRADEIVGRFITALEEGDSDAIVELLSDDASFEMPPYPGSVRGRERIRSSWLIPERRPTGVRAFPVGMNGQRALAVYSLAPGMKEYLPAAIDVLELRGERITRVVAFRSVARFGELGLPESLPAE